MMAADILIRKEKFKIRTSNEQLGLRVRKQLNDTLQYDLTDMMEETFAVAALPDFYLTLDQLKIDIGIVSENDFEQHFVKLVASKLVIELQKRLPPNGNQAYETSKKPDKFYSDDDAARFPQSNSVKKQEFIALLHFLENGIYPWWYKEDILQTPEQLLNNLTEDEIKTLLLRLLETKNKYSEEEIIIIVRRLLIHLPAAKNETIVHLLLSLQHHGSDLIKTGVFIKRQKEIMQLFSISSKEFCRLLFEFVMTENITTGANILHRFMVRLMEVQMTSLKIIKDKIELIKGDDTLLATELRQLLVTDKEEAITLTHDRTKIPAQVKPDRKNEDQQSLQNHSDEDQQSSRNRSDEDPQPLHNRSHEDQQSLRNRSDEDQQSLHNRSEEDTGSTEPIDAALPAGNKFKINKKQRHTSVKAEEGIYVGNAGLVLLHPFLVAFFSNAALLDKKNNFISDVARQKAAVLLYYLQCGNEQYKEWEMAFNKIICGIALNDLVADNIIITKREKDECKNLLQTVADYWEALKGASIEALQSTFILRAGKIILKDNHWSMQVERTGVDVLLDRLPWSYSLIKLPWLDKIIYTEW